MDALDTVLIDLDAFDVESYDHDLINLGNGVYDLTDDEFRENDPKYYVQTLISCDLLENRNQIASMKRSLSSAFGTVSTPAIDL